MAVSKKTRFEVFKRDGFRCLYCGRTPPAVVLQIDHVLARAAEGGDEVENLATACEDCNSGKGARPLNEAPESLTETMARRIELAEQMEAFNAFLMKRREAEDEAIERLGLDWFGRLYGAANRYVFGTDRVTSVRTFLKHLTEAEILDGIDAAFGRCSPYHKNDTRTWKYFCGVCWNKIRARGA